MGTAAEFLADVVGVGADVEALAAHDAEVDFCRGDLAEFVVVNGDEPGLALYDLALAG